jgi:hypothetical protein
MIMLMLMHAVLDQQIFNITQIHLNFFRSSLEFDSRRINIIINSLNSVLHDLQKPQEKLKNNEGMFARIWVIKSDLFFYHISL